MSTYLIDTNIWLRVVQPESAQHQIAVDAIAALLVQGEEICVTAQNLIEFWSVASRPASANGLGWNTEVVHTEVDRMLAQFPLLDDTSTVLTHWLHLVATYNVVGRRVHDARLVAVMLAHGIPCSTQFKAAMLQSRSMMSFIYDELDSAFGFTLHYLMTMRALQR